MTVCYTFASAVGAHAQAPPKKNIIVIMADDMELNDLPFFSDEPIQWADENNPEPPLPVADPADDEAPDKATEEPRFGEAARRLPGLNRLAARMLANRPDPQHPMPSDRKLGLYHPLSGGAPYLAVPGDLDDNETPQTSITAAGFRYAQPNAECGTVTVSSGKFSDPGVCSPKEASVDILEHFGGLARLAGANSVIFPRFYSNSAVCAPTRGAFMTGRSNARLGMKKFGASLKPDEITIAEFLKQGCQSAEPKHRLCVNWDASPPTFMDCPCYLGQADCGSIETKAACYTTGALGKWHIGDKGGGTPWRQGFDEYIGFLGGFRSYVKIDKLVCSPDTQRHCVGGSQAGQSCFDDTDCEGTTNGACSLEPGFAQASGPTGLYIGGDPNSSNTCSNGTAANNDVDCCVAVNKKGPFGHYDLESKGFTKPKKDNMLCNPDGDVASTHCPYYTRMIRDHAKGFIRRHAGEDDPFFLFVSFNAIHFPKNAPARTLAHYKRAKSSETLNTNKVMKRKLLAMIEELDAAVGGIIDELKDTTTGHADISGETMILFIADQGQQRQNGNPNLAGGKGTVMEGGIRIGMLAYDVGLFPGAGVTSTTLPGPGGTRLLPGTTTTVVGDGFLGSMVDLFPTIADAAGYGKSGMGGFSSGSRGIFDNQGRIAVPLETGSGGKRVDGRSLLPVMEGNAPPSDLQARDFTYARYFSDANTIVSRKGYYADNPDCDGVSGSNACAGAAKVCGYLATVGECQSGGQTCTSNADCGTGPCNTDRVVRTVRGASCTTCDTDLNCKNPLANPPVLEKCTILGGVCLAKDSPTRGLCIDGDPATDCPITKLRRCVTDKDCPKLADSAKLECVDDPSIVVPCNRCFDAAWKYRDSGKSERGKTRLTDLTTNPEEKTSPEATSLVLDCFVKTCDTSQPICQVQTDLAARLKAWDQCVKSSQAICDDDVCEDLPSQQACMP